VDFIDADQLANDLPKNGDQLGKVDRKFAIVASAVDVALNSFHAIGGPGCSLVGLELPLEVIDVHREDLDHRSVPEVELGVHNIPDEDVGLVQSLAVQAGVSPCYIGYLAVYPGF